MKRLRGFVIVMFLAGIVIGVMNVVVPTAQQPGTVTPTPNTQVPPRPTPPATPTAANYIRGSFGTVITSTGSALNVALPYGDPCAAPIKGNVAISQTANARLLSGTGRRIYICSVFVVGADAENIAFVEGTGSTCATTTAGIIGGATAATGPNLAANGGFTLGSGAGTVAIGNGQDVCLFQSGAGRVAGNLTYVVQ